MFWANKNTLAKIGHEGRLLVFNFNSIYLGCLFFFYEISFVSGIEEV